MVKNTTYLHRQTLSQSLEISAQQTSQHPSSFSVQNQMQMYSTNRPYISLENSANKTGRTAAKQAILFPRTSCQKCKPYTQAVPRKLC